jgi:hypothetical protein
VCVCVCVGEQGGKGGAWRCGHRGGGATGAAPPSPAARRPHARRVSSSSSSLSLSLTGRARSWWGAGAGGRVSLQAKKENGASEIFHSAVFFFCRLPREDPRAQSKCRPPFSRPPSNGRARRVAERARACGWRGEGGRGGGHWRSHPLEGATAAAPRGPPRPPAPAPNSGPPRPGCGRVRVTVARQAWGGGGGGARAVGGAHTPKG